MLKEIRQVRNKPSSANGRCENMDTPAPYVGIVKSRWKTDQEVYLSIQSVTRQLFCPASDHLEWSRCRVIAGSSKVIFFREPVYSESASSASYSCGRPLEKHRTRKIPTEELASALDSSIPRASTIARPNSRTRLQTSRVIKMQFSIFLVYFRLRRGGGEEGGEERGHSTWYSNPFSVKDARAECRLSGCVKSFFDGVFDKGIIYHERKISHSFSHSIVLSRKFLSGWSSGNSASSDYRVLHPEVILARMRL